MPNRKKLETIREQMEMQDAEWESYKIEGPTLEEILKTKPRAAESKALIWDKSKREWRTYESEIIEEV